LKKAFIHIICLLFVCCMAWNIPVNAQDNTADNMLLFQRTIGGWAKSYNGKQPVDYKKTYSDTEKAAISDEQGRNDATIDNGATNKEIRYLLKAYKGSGNKTYLDGAEKGISYLLKAQYQNGGWPQFYPDHSSYRGEITFNDNAMMNTMALMDDLANKRGDFAVVNEKLARSATKAVEKGIDCILKTQVKVNGKLTAWCAQYNDVTLEPAKARAYELPSLSGNESVAIVDFLMRRPNPSNAIKQSVNSAIAWFTAVQIKGYKVAAVKDASLPKGFDRMLQPDSNNVMWARFYDIETNDPFFCGRDGVKKKSLADIEPERRNGYAWYGTWPKALIEEKYPAWKATNG
jgi:PelA/Pel-15E family pectate lyase